MADGKGCKCAAYSSHECACDADWTSQEVYDLKEELALCKSSNGKLCFEILAMQKELDSLRVALKEERALFSLQVEHIKTLEDKIKQLEYIKSSIPNPCYSQAEVNRIVGEKLKIAVEDFEAISVCRPQYFCTNPPTYFYQKMAKEALKKIRGGE